MIMEEIAISCASTKDLSQTIKETVKEFGFQLKQEQMQAIHRCMEGGDVFVSLPTEYSKSLFYLLLPSIFNAYCYLLPEHLDMKTFRHNSSVFLKSLSVTHISP